MRRFDAAFRREKGAASLLGVDEAGRGPLAGPVVVAAVLLPDGDLPELSRADDSKKLSARERERLFPLIRAKALAVSVAWAHPAAIDRDNILRATLGAMKRAVSRVRQDALVLVDGNRAIPGLGRPQVPLVDADAKSLSVACASIVAKVVRDRWMESMDRRYPSYGFSRHKGYGTAFHLERLRALGPSPIHRRSFAPVARARP
ncbi:MAG: ribonuclease HII [Elusimicrobia bacterium]|nr:ribonuclease HII [Elusimicrobiota bacterium]MDE2313364.1 ribonuclease HII [Elusimicrobiota bacterium]